MKRRRIRTEFKIFAVIIMFIFLLTHYIWYIKDLNERQKEYESFTNPIEDISTKKKDAKDELQAIDVYFTNYHLGDGSSGTTTASGLQIKHFEVNEDGMYTYDGKVVVATANMTRLERGIAEGYLSHELYEEFTIRLNDKEYEAIVLDVCGSCYYTEGEFLQRYDIFATSNVIGKVLGQIIQKVNE